MTIAVRGICPLLQVFDMPVSLHFYRDLLGFAEVQKSGVGDDVGWAWVRNGDAGIMLNTAYDRGKRPRGPDLARMAAHEDTCLYMGCADLDGLHAYLQSVGVKVQPPRVAPYGMRQLYLRDPDGYNLCFQWAVNALPDENVDAE